MSFTTAQDSEAIPFEWRYIPEMPDADIRCVVAVENMPDTFEAHTDGKNWFRDTCVGTRRVTGKVYAWAYFPDAPPMKEAHHA